MANISFAISGRDEDETTQFLALREKLISDTSSLELPRVRAEAGIRGLPCERRGTDHEENDDAGTCARWATIGLFFFFSRQAMWSDPSIPATAGPCRSPDRRRTKACLQQIYGDVARRRSNG